MLGLLYLGLIPAFAGLYVALGPAFYHSTVRLEAALAEDAEALKPLLAAAIARQFEAANGTLAWQSGNHRMDVSNDLTVDLIRADGDRVVFSLTTHLHDVGDQNQSYVFADYAVEGDASRWMGTEPYYARQVTVATGRSGVVAASDLFAFGSGDSSRPPYLVLNEGDNAAFTAWWRAENGEPSRATDSYWRMLYLSAVTITTVGYGDIVPITTTARLFVGLEAVLGVVVAGLFLAALARRRRV